MEENNYFNSPEIMSEEDVASLFNDSGQVEETQENPDDNGTPNEMNPRDITEADAEHIFDDGSQPESVGSEENNNEGGDTNPNDEGADSPNNFFSSTALAFREEGIFTDIDDEKIKSIQTPEDIVGLMQNEIDKRKTEQEKRVYNALNYGVEPDAIRQFEGLLTDLRNVKMEDLLEKSQKGEDLRRNIMMLDYMQQGMSEDKAKRFVDKSFETGSDLDDAKDALTSSITKAEKDYNNLIAEAKKASEAEKEEIKRQGEQLREDLYKKSKIFEGFEVNESARKKAYEVLTKPVYENKETGEVLTELQKYEREHKMEFLKYMGLFYVLTNGFTNMEGLIGTGVKKETKKIWKELDHQFRTQNPVGGNMHYVGSQSGNKENDGWVPYL